MRDVYASLAAVDEPAGTAAIRLFVNPGIGLLWLGGGIVALGGLVAAWPGRRRASPVAVVEAAPERREEVPV
jgi:cytochrome c-type biogenesis protein CcmF